MNCITAGLFLLSPTTALVMVLFCTGDRFGWGWENFMHEANQERV